MNLVKDEHESYLSEAKKISVTKELAHRLIPFIDLTSLNESDNPSVIAQLCDRAITPYGNVAAVCAYPQFVKQIRDALSSTKIKIATVANFPEANSDISIVLKTIHQAQLDGANEIDIVMPYSAFLQGDLKHVSSFINIAKEACGNMLLKIILETGALINSDLIYQASCLAIDAGADFIKTSTGKISTRASLEAAASMLLAIKEKNRHVGFKASGGIRTPQQAAEFFHLTELMMGKTWATEKTFRLGASTLLDSLVL